MNRPAPSLIPILILSITLVLPVSPGRTQEQVRIDLSAEWMRRDWAKCRSRAELIQQDSLITVLSDTTASLFWQTPTRTGAPLPISQTQKWVLECDRPPPEFGKQLRKQDLAGEHLLSVTEYRHVTWRWRVSDTIDDAHAGKKGHQPEEMFTARLGITILKKGGEDLREIAYVWTRSLPENRIFVNETVVIPRLWTYRWYRIVARSSPANPDHWVPESRDLYADYKRLYPKEEPGRIVRLYLRVDTPTFENRITGDFADIIFHHHPRD